MIAFIDKYRYGMGVQPREGRVNADEHRKFRASLYRPLLELHLAERRRIVDTILAILLDTDTDVDP